ncbi:14734_t:CDS:1 [Racocetra fulgida]|uniref:14734_t:CDS:1 n=1 Tax=Racocetra fulgida TaxID=60492 RepID=A0A9N9AUM1_9GLOM|nr:14734_t:CDS:1 [Racocetra fulgida]
MEELESFSSNCALSDKKIERDKKIDEIESLAVCLALIKEILTKKRPLLKKTDYRRAIK